MITLTREEAQQVLCAIQENWRTHEGDKAIGTLRARLAEPEKEQEPVAWYVRFDSGRADLLATPISDARRAMWESSGKRFTVTPLYTAPPQREWVGLTDEEIRNEANHHVFDESFFSGAVWARGKIKEKNNG